MKASCHDVKSYISLECETLYNIGRGEDEGKPGATWNGVQIGLAPPCINTALCYFQYHHLLTDMCMNIPLQK